MYPCICEKGTDSGLYIRCENAGLALISVGIGNIAGMGLPIERLLLKECKFTNLFGSLLHRSTVRILEIVDTPITSIEEYAFAGVNRTLQEIYLTNTKLIDFPKEAFKILGNLSVLSIDGHQMTKLSKDMFAGSEAVGKLERLHLVNGLISDIPIEAFQNLRKLKKLDLHGNRLMTLKKNQFKGLRDTDVLDLSHNNITRLDGSHIGDLTKLGWCNVSHNDIKEIPRGMFARNNLLKVLHLDNNKLKKLDTNSFRGMRFLRRLFLQDNQISDIGRGTFSAVTRIGTVDLARNKIKKVDYQMFQSVKFADTINLAENEITVIEAQAFTDLYLATVNVSHNQLSKIEPKAFQNCNNLTVLDLRYNNLTVIDRSAFDENTYAYELNVAHNHITDFSQIPIQNMTGIRILNATFNQITGIPKAAFPKLYELHTVDLSHNNISDIFNAVFQNLFSLRFVNLSHNSLERIKPAMFGTLPTVLELDLSHNLLSDVSRGGLAKLASCRLLDMSHNQLEKIFQIPISLGELNIAHNNLREIKSNTWPSMNALLRLNLSANMLGDMLASDSFSSLLTLQTLDLSSNGLTRPPWEALSSLTSLQYIYMQDNNLTSLSKSSFGNLPTLFALDLSRNAIASVERRAFNGLQQLLDLKLSGNQLEHVPNEAFKGLVALRKLDLSHNLLEKIDNKTNGLLDDCLSLETVNLSHNNIGFLTKKMFPASPWIPYRLSEIDLSHNSLAVVTHDITVGAGRVRRLSLAGNYINDIRNNVLGNLTSLETLDLSRNNLKDLVSKTSEMKFSFPGNITELYLNDNELEDLPVKELMKADKLKVLDVRGNRLTSFDPRLVARVRDRGLQVYFEGNTLLCDCFARPLKHYLNKLSQTYLRGDAKYSNVSCAEPPSLENVSILDVDEERLLCAGNIETDEKIKEYGNTADESFDFITEPDLAFRDIQYSQEAIYVHWYVRSAGDVADTQLYVRGQGGDVLHAARAPYTARSYTVPLDAGVRGALGGGGALCVQAVTSAGAPRRWYPSQCQPINGRLHLWPKTLNVDKRRLSRPRGRATSSVLGLVSDSILITLCIFLGVCLKITDVEL